jgi:hypothetical protein
MTRRIVIVAALAATAAMAAPQAEARGFIGFGFGVPLAPVPVYPPPVYYAYPPPPAVVYPAPPPVAYPAPPAAYSTAPQGAAPPACREYQNSVTIGGQRRDSFGTACLQPDGSWRIVQ